MYLNTVKQNSNSRILVTNKKYGEGTLEIYVEIYPKDYVSDFRYKKYPDDFVRVEDRKEDVMLILSKSPLKPSSIEDYETLSTREEYWFVTANWDFKFPTVFKGNMTNEIFSLLEYLQDSFDCGIFI